MDEVIPDDLKGSMESLELPCKVGGFDAIVVLAYLERDHFLSGRIALLSDEKALEHVRNVKAWR